MKNILLIVGACAVALASFSASALDVPLVNGPGYTNATVVVGNSTNQVGVVLGASTNYYNLTFGASTPLAGNYAFGGSQANTNQWPVVGLALGTGYPNTLYGPANKITVFANTQLQATNSSSTTLTYKWAAVMDGTQGTVISNYLVLAQTIPVNNTTAPPAFTNIETYGIQNLVLQQIENPGANAATNALIHAGVKAGF